MKDPQEREFQELVQQVNTLMMQVKEAEAYYNQLKNLLKQADEKLAKKNLDPVYVAKYAIKASNALAPRTSCLSCNFYFMKCNRGLSPSL